MPNPLNLRPPRYRETPAFRKAVDHYEGLDVHDDDPAADVKYEYARFRYDQTSAFLNGLDRKAESQVRFAAVLAGALLTVLKLTGNLAALIAPLTPSLIAFTLAMAAALIARQTVVWASPLDVEHALDLRGDEGAVKKRLAASLNCAVEGNKALSAWKSQWCDRATWLLAIGVVLLALLLFVDGGAINPS